MMTIDSAIPPTIGILRASVSDTPRRISPSDSIPPSTPPRNPQIAGSDVMKPAFSSDMPRACTR